MRWPTTVARVPAEGPSPSPTGSPAPADDSGADDDLARILDNFGIDPNDVPIWQTDGISLFAFVVLAALAVLLLRAVYRGMQRPRLALTEHADRPPTASWAAVGRYLFTPLVLLPLWFITVLGILILAGARGDYGFRPPEELVIAAVVVVGAARLLAHVNREGAHELAKSVPLTMLTLLFVSGQVITGEGFLVVTFLMFVNLDSLLYYMVLLALWDVMFTAGWLVLQRIKWNREQRPEADRSLTWPRRVWNAIVEGWGSSESGPATTAEWQTGQVEPAPAGPPGAPPASPAPSPDRST